LSDLETLLGHRFQRPELLERALTHRSWAFERGTEPTYERLEFLGDAVLGALTARWLWERVPDGEGELSKLKAHLVSGPRLATYARRLDLGRHLRLGVGEERSGGREKESLLADVFEAVLAALYLDGGIEAARRLVEPFLEEMLRSYDGEGFGKDPKTVLQETLQARGMELPEYRLVEESGPDHAKTFRVAVWVGRRSLAQGAGTSKKRAEQAAAESALEVLESEEAR
jgi:ribonuclease-3